MLDDFDLHYLGGIIDGEGSILITKRGFRYDGVLSIGMTDEYPIKLLSTEFNLPYHLKIEKSGKCSYNMYVSAKKCSVVLKQLLPFIRVKRMEARLVLALFLLRENKRIYYVEKNRKMLHAKHGEPRSIPNKVLGLEFFIRAEKLYKRCKLLKTKERNITV